MPENLTTDEIFVNGDRQILARYPNFDPTAQYFDGFAADAISPEQAARWADPTGGYFHAMHPSLWGDFTWRITGKDPQGAVTKEGGWQNNRGGAMHRTIRFVENIFEELDAPGEWFLNAKTHTLYFYPRAGLDLSKATVEATRLRSLVEYRGSEDKSVRFVTLRGLTFRHAARTVMDTKEPLMRSDWAIYRGGAIFFDGAEDCAVEDSLLDQVGGNAIFVNNYRRRLLVLPHYQQSMPAGRHKEPRGLRTCRREQHHGRLGPQPSRLARRERPQYRRSGRDVRLRPTRRHGRARIGSPKQLGPGKSRAEKERSGLRRRHRPVDGAQWRGHSRTTST